MTWTKSIWEFVERNWLAAAVIVLFSLVLWNQCAKHNRAGAKVSEMTKEEVEYLVILHGIISNDSLVPENCIRRANTFYKVYKERAKLD